ncbi:MAG: type II toxin-antitoxin system RatA family toxin, partial [Hyphomicrobiales bacterium]|nr:type II toxin-antitoxin system RatA family toxin [Hyphomicrobiales bacterium]
RLVADVERYPEFVPLCQSLSVRRRIDNADGTTALIASMTVGYKAIRETFTSRVVLDLAARRIDVAYVDGPLSRMENRWTFRDEGPGASTVGFFIVYEFRNRLLAGLMGHMFDRAFRKMSEAFEGRADAVYGAAG